MRGTEVCRPAVRLLYVIYATSGVLQRTTLSHILLYYSFILISIKFSHGKVSRSTAVVSEISQQLLDELP